MGRRGRTSVLATLRRVAQVPGVPGRYAAPFWAVTGVHLTAQLARALGVPGAEVVAPVSKALLVPALAVVLGKGLTSVSGAVSATDKGPARAGQPAGQARQGAAGAVLPSWWPLAAVGVAFSWLGDLALINPDLFLAGVGLFGIAQVAYARAFVQAGDPARTAGRPGLVVPYAVWWLGLAGFFLATGGVSPMLFAVATYGLALGSMAYLAHRISPATAIGAALFVLSDSLIGLGGAGLEVPAHGFWVMSTYLVAQWLIVRGLVGQAHLDRAAAGQAAAPATSRVTTEVAP